MKRNIVTADADKIVQLRGERGWSQEKLAEKAIISKKTIENIESAKQVQLSTLSKIAKALGVKVEELRLGMKGLQQINKKSLRLEDDNGEKPSLIAPLDRAILEWAFDAFRKAEVYLISQISDRQPGWGPEPGLSMDPWTTSQMAFFFCRSEYSNLILRSLGWLIDQQRPDGSWGSEAHKDEMSDTPATACCTIALLEHFGVPSIPAQKGLQWLCQQYKQGWTTLPLDTRARYQEVHYYSTSYALRALSRGPKLPIHSLCVQEGMTVLLKSQVKDTGWGSNNNLIADPTYTSYVMHGLLDVATVWGLNIPSENISCAVKWLRNAQNEDGSWSDWHGIKASPESTGYAIYILLRAGISVNSPQIRRAVQWLLKAQNSDGSWGMGHGSAERPNNWVTYSAAMGLKTLLAVSVDRFDAGFRAQPSQYAYLNDPQLVGKEIAHPDVSASDGADTYDSTRQLYRICLQESWNHIPYTRPLDHTMFEALDHYVAQKLPNEEIKETLINGLGIEVHGIYPDHFVAIASSLKMSEVVEIPFRHKNAETPFNEKRPRFFRANREGDRPLLVASVTPGRDYVLHYASLIRHVAYFHTTRAERLIQIYRYPYAENHVAEWTKLNKDIVARGDTVIIGYVSAVHAIFEMNDTLRFVRYKENDFYGSYQYALPNGSIVNLLGVKYSFWGSISEVLASALCEMGVSEIIYLAKLGALSSVDDIYSRIFCPSEYAVMNYNQVIYTICNVPNGVLKRFPHLDSGCHVSVPTVLEEDYNQRRVTDELKARSIDNEIAQIARAVSAHNYNHNSSVSFSALHFATDYVRSSDFRVVQTPFDLGNNRTIGAVRAKQRMIQTICDTVLIPYLTQ